MRVYSFITIRRLKTLWLSIILVLSGYLVSEFNKPEHRPNNYRRLLHKSDYCEIEIKDEPDEKEKSIKILAEVVSIVKHNCIVPSKGDVLLYFKKTLKSKELKCGDHLLIPNRFHDIKNSGNPGAFDYGSYCRSQGIYQSAFLNDHHFETTLKNHSSPTWLTRISNNIKNKLATHILNPQARGMAIALLIGYRKGIDNETYQAYASTGLMHLIAISGMHIGMIYLTIQFILQCIPFFNQKIMLRTIVALLALWSFAIMIGLPPSVYRSAFMFSLIGIGQIFKRKINIYNNLACSAFVLLCQHPAWITDIGFQLSYLAVLSIALCYHGIYRQLYFKNKIIDKIWQTASVTIAAQILTFPLCIFYFHQFPLLFIINNLIGIFFTTFIIYGELLMLITSIIPNISLLIGKCITYLILLLNQIVVKLSKLDNFIWSGIQINQIQVLLLFLVILSFLVFNQNRRIRPLIVSLSLLICFLCIQISNQLNHLQQNKFVVYCSHNQSLLGFISGNQYKYIIGNKTTDSNKLNQYVFIPSQNFFHTKRSNFNLVGIHNMESLSLYLYGNKTIVHILDENIRTKGPFSSDFIIIGNGKFNNIVNTVRQFGHPVIIFDSSLPEWKTNKYSRDLIKKWPFILYCDPEWGFYYRYLVILG